MDLSRVSVVVIDDQDVVRGMVRGLLRKLGVSEVTLAGDVPEGLAAIEAAKAGLVLCDINMPGRNGLELLRDVRAGVVPAIRRDVPIAMLTGHTDQAIVGTALALDAHAFIAKPVSAAQLGERINRIFLRPVPIREAAVYRGIEIPDFRLPTPSGAPLNPGVLLPPPTAPLREPAMVQKDLVAVLPGAVLARDMRGVSGNLLLAKGQVLTASLLDRLSDLAEFDETIRVVWVRV
ncbi:MAG: response regulator [Alphaproteobacteria bacterium]|nr:response regulator [Alphaproteobacteria bacterium]